MAYASLVYNIKKKMRNLGIHPFIINAYNPHYPWRPLVYIKGSQCYHSCRHKAFLFPLTAMEQRWCSG